MADPIALPLAGRRVLVTRAQTQAGTLAGALSAAGAEVIVVPLAEYLPAIDPGAIERAIADLAPGQWVAFTSANGVHFAVSPARIAAFQRARLAVVGLGTAAALRANGLAPEIIARPATAAGLAQALLAHPAGAIALFQADLARPALAQALAAGGWQVTAVTAYRTRPLDLDPNRLGRLDAITIASSATAERLASALGSGLAQLRAAGCRFYAIGPETAATMERLGFPPAAMAPMATAAALARTVAEDLGPG
jgi:uroporphyrinogen-III synthase